jgi:hypothetical protein
MNAITGSLECPVCGAEMKITKTGRGELTQWRRFKCTCGHCEDRKEDNSTSFHTHALFALDGFQEFPLNEKKSKTDPVD